MYPSFGYDANVVISQLSKNIILLPLLKQHIVCGISCGIFQKLIILREFGISLG